MVQRASKSVNCQFCFLVDKRTAMEKEAFWKRRKLLRGRLTEKNGEKPHMATDTCMYGSMTWAIGKTEMEKKVI